MRFLRFETSLREDGTGLPLGVFHAIGRVRDRGELLPDLEPWYQDLIDWFGQNLAVPARFRSRAGSVGGGEAVCWFKDSAREHLLRARSLAALLAEHDVAVDRLASKDPGYVVWEDEHQVAAVPFATRKRRRPRHVRRVRCC